MFFEALFSGVVEECAGAAECWFLAAAEIVEVMLVGVFEQLVLFAECADVFFARLELVIANENGFAVGAGKGGHAVVFARDKEAIVQALALAGDGLIGEAFGEVEKFFRVGFERHFGGLLAGGGAAGDVAQAGEANGDDGGVAEEITTGKGHLEAPMML